MLTLAYCLQLFGELLSREIRYDRRIPASEKTVCIPEIHHMIMPKKKGSGKSIISLHLFACWSISSSPLHNPDLVFSKPVKLAE
jgi:hypothetical protein